ncbi:MAG: cytochrome c oxidase subunit 3 [Actinomycetota bacterium]
MSATGSGPLVITEKDLPRLVAGGTAPAYWGRWMLIATEAMLFGSLIAAYFFVRFQSSSVWPPDGIAIPELSLPLIMSAILWSSSVPVHIADRAVRAGDQGRLRWGLALGFLLGAIFLGIMLLVEYPEKLDEFTPTTNAYGSLFFTLTGFHGAHVAIGLLFSLWTQARAWKGAFGTDRHLTVHFFALYWHFVDAVWAFVLATIYLSPNFVG